MSKRQAKQMLKSETYHMGNLTSDIGLNSHMDFLYSSTNQQSALGVLTDNQGPKNNDITQY